MHPNFRPIKLHCGMCIIQEYLLKMTSLSKNLKRIKYVFQFFVSETSIARKILVLLNYQSI